MSTYPVDLTGWTPEETDEAFRRVAAKEKPEAVAADIRWRHVASPAIVGELAALGASQAAAQRIAAHAVYRFLADVATEHNGLPRRYRTVLDRPDEAAVDRLPAEYCPAAGTICLELVRLARTAGGPACPEMGLPMAYAAEAIANAARTALEA